MPCPRKLLATAIPLFIIATMLVACSSDSPTTPTDQPAPLAETTLDPTGGTLETEDFHLQIPPNQLPTPTTLTLYPESQSSPQPTAEASPVYRLTGLPYGLTESLPIRIRHNAASPTAPLHIMLGQLSHTPSLGTRQLNWQLIACTDSSGWALADLPLTGPAASTKDEAPPVHVTVTEGLVPTLSPEQNFQINYHPDQVSELDIEALGIELESALSLYQFMGYEQPGFNAWPLQVNVHPIDAYGYWNPDPRHLGGHITLAPEVVTDVIEQATTVGHEMFHFCQYFYDPRTVLERGTVGPDHRWLDEATAVHMESYFAPPEYQYVARISRELTLLNGLLIPRDGMTLGQHGYGVSSIIRYLAQTEQGGDNFLLNLYEDLATGTHAVAALQAATATDITAQWQHILEELVLGNIYEDVTWPVLEAQAGPTLLSVGSAADTTGTLSGRMNDLSGLLATVELDYADWSDQHRLELWTEQSDCGLSVIGITSAGDRQLVASGTPAVTLSDPAQLQNLYDKLLVLVSNPRLQAPGYNGDRPITLQARVRSAEVAYHYPRLSFHLQFDADWDDESISVNQEINIYNADGTFEDGIFTAAWDSTIDDGAVRFVGSLSVEVDLDFRWVSSWSAQTAIWHSDETGIEYQASGGQVPATNLYPHSFSAWVEGTDSCDAIDTVAMTEVNNAGSRHLTVFSCRSSSYVKFFFVNPGTE